MKTNVSETSLIAYEDVKLTGKESSQIKVIYRILEIQNKPLSLREIAYLYKICTGLPIDISAVSARVNKLKKDNRAQVFEERNCTITGKLILPVGLTVEQLEMAV
jgi:hypothetical protein